MEQKDKAGAVVYRGCFSLNKSRAIDGIGRLFIDQAHKDYLSEYRERGRCQKANDLHLVDSYVPGTRSCILHFV